MINIGSSSLSAIRLGEDDMSRVYVGDALVWEKGGLPVGYTAVKRLIASATQWINTGVSADRNTTFTVDFDNVSEKGSVRTYLFGQYDSNNAFAISIIDSQIQANVGTAMGQGGATYRGGRCTVILSASSMYVDGALNTTYASGFNSSSTSLALFGALRGTTIYERARLYTLALYSAVIEKSGEITNNFVPCLDKSGKPCVYDTITKQTRYNSGTGEFGYELMNGTIVAPR